MEQASSLSCFVKFCYQHYAVDQARRGLSLLNQKLMDNELSKKELLESLLEKVTDHRMALRELLNQWVISFLVALWPTIH